MILFALTLSESAIFGGSGSRQSAAPGFVARSATLVYGARLGLGKPGKKNNLKCVVFS